MKRMLLVIALIALLPVFADAADVTLAWDASVGADGYAIFSRDFQTGYGTSVWSGPGLTCTVTVPDDRQTAFVARAFKYGPYDLDGNRTTEWSGNSNEIVYVPSVIPPEPPAGFNIFQVILAALKWFFTLKWLALF